MEARQKKKLIINIAGLIVIIAAATVFYIFYAGPRLKEWREARAEIKKREEELNRLKKLFNNQEDPRTELKTLYIEISSLENAIKKLEKVKKPGMETKDLPPELKDPDPLIEKELVRDYMRDVMETTEQKIKDQLTAAQISPPDIQLYTGLGSAEEAAYYMNRAGGLQGIIDALVETQTEGGRVVFDELRLEPYTKGKQRRRGAVNILSYGLQMTMNLENLISFIYHLQEQDGYYFLEQLAIKPGMSRAGTQTPLDVNATVNTLLVFKSEEKKAVKRAAAETTKQRAASKVSGGRVGGLVGLAMGMRRTIEAEKEAEKNKKWYEFWK